MDLLNSTLDLDSNFSHHSENFPEQGAGKTVESWAFVDSSGLVLCDLIPHLISKAR